MARSISKNTYGVSSGPHLDGRAQLPSDLAAPGFVAVDTVVEPSPVPSPTPSPSPSVSSSPEPSSVEKASLPDEQTIAVSGDALDEFRASGRTVIDAPAVAQAGSALFVVNVNYTADDIRQLGLDKFKVLATGMKNGMVGVEIRKDIDRAIVESVEDQLVGMKIVLKGAAGGSSAN